MRGGSYGVAVAAMLGQVVLAQMAFAQAKPAVIQQPAYSGNYTNASRGPAQIDMIIIHDVEGTAPGAASWFANPASKASAHYNVHYDGRIWQSVQDEDVAWHAGNYSINLRSIGVEHSGYAARNLYTDEEYRASAKLVAY